MDCPLCGTTCTCSVPSVAARINSRGSLTTSEIVDGPVVPNSIVDARVRMQSGETFQSSFLSDPSNQAAGEEAWRAEVASRVNKYRARKGKAREDSPALDFGPAAESQNIGSQEIPHPASFVLQDSPAPAARREPPKNHKSTAHNAFDTNYYRRLNAEAMSQGFTLGATAAAPAPAHELELEPETESAAVACAEPAEDLALDLEIRPNVAADSFLDRYCISEPEPEASVVEEPEPVIPAVPQGNLIVFRRPLIEPPLAPKPSRDELAEPMNYRPRILEVPEDIMPAVQGSLFPEIRLDADEGESSSNHEPEIQVPLRVAMISERLSASLTDFGLVAAAGLLFAGIAWRALPEVPHTKPFFMVLGAVTLLLWAVYQHLFLLYGGRTPGMKLKGIRLSTFNGRTPRWKQRASRARFMCISFASVALGFLWALVDEDELCWHDRISQTFPTTE